MAVHITVVVHVMAVILVTDSAAVVPRVLLLLLLLLVVLLVVWWSSVVLAAVHWRAVVTAACQPIVCSTTKQYRCSNRSNRSLSTSGSNDGGSSCARSHV
jgi:hypothetical protein